MSALCPICTHVEAHGSYGPAHRGSHCRGCHRSWSGTYQAHCATCHRHFASPAAFEHHIATRARGEVIEHLDPAKLIDKAAGEAKLVADEDGTWHTPAPDKPLSHWLAAS